MGFAGKCAGAIAVLTVLSGCQMGGHPQRAMGDEPAAAPPASDAAPAGGSVTTPGVSAADFRDSLASWIRGTTTR